MLASTTTQDEKKSTLINGCKTNTMLPLDPATFILEAVGNIMIQYLSYKDILNVSLVCQTWYCLVKQCSNFVADTMELKVNRIYDVGKYYKSDFDNEHAKLLIEELQETMATSTNLYHMKELIKKVMGGRLYSFCTQDVNTNSEKRIVMDIISLKAKIKVDIVSVEKMLYIYSLMEKDWYDVRKKHLKLILGEDPKKKKVICNMQSFMSSKENKKTMLTKDSNTSSDLPSELVTIVLKAVCDKILQYLPYKDVLGTTLVSTTWYSLVKGSRNIVSQIIQRKLKKFYDSRMKFNGKAVICHVGFLLKELKKKIEISTNLYHMRTLMQEVMDGENYYWCASGNIRDDEKMIMEEIISLKVKIKEDIKIVKDMIYSCSFTEKDWYIARKKFLVFVLGEKPKKKKVIYDRLCLEGDEIIKRDPRYSNVWKPFIFE